MDFIRTHSKLFVGALAIVIGVLIIGIIAGYDFPFTTGEQANEQYTLSGTNTEKALQVISALSLIPHPSVYEAHTMEERHALEQVLRIELPQGLSARELPLTDPELASLFLWVDADGSRLGVATSTRITFAMVQEAYPEAIDCHDANETDSLITPPGTCLLRVPLGEVGRLMQFDFADGFLRQVYFGPWTSTYNYPEILYPEILP